MATTATQAPTLEALHAKIDALAEQIGFLAREMEEMRRQREVWTDLSRDLSPVLESIYLLAVEHLDEMSPYVQIEDLLRFGLRFLRSARLLERALQELETLYDMARDLSPVAHDAFVLTVQKLDEMEKKGYFALLRELAQTLDQLVSHVQPEDVQHLRQALVQVLDQARQGDGLDTSLRGLMRLMRDSDVRRGLALGLHLLRALGQWAAVRETKVEGRSLPAPNP